LGHCVKSQGHQGQMCQNWFRSITQERLDLPSSNLVHTSILGSKWVLLILRSLGKSSRSLWPSVPNQFRINN